jgi:ferrochelatase
MDAVTNQPKLYEPMPDEPRSETDLDAAIRDLGRVRHAETWGAAPAEGEAAAAEPAALETAGETAEPASAGATSPATEGEGAAADETQRGDNEQVSDEVQVGDDDQVGGDDDDDLFAPEPAADTDPPRPERPLLQVVPEPEPRPESTLSDADAGPGSPELASSAAAADPEAEEPPYTLIDDTADALPFPPAEEPEPILRSDLDAAREPSDFDGNEDEDEGERPEEEKPPVRAEAEPTAAFRLPPVSHLSPLATPRDAAGEEFAEPASEPPHSSDPPSLPRRMFGLKRALDAHRLGVTVDDLPPPEPQPEMAAFEADSHAEPAGIAEASALPENPAPAGAVEPVALIASMVQRQQPQAEAAQEPAPAPTPMPVPARRGWFGLGRKAPPAREPEPQAGASAEKPTEASATPAPAPDKASPLTTEASTQASPEAATAATAVAAATMAAGRKGWFRRRKAEPKAQPKPEEPQAAAAEAAPQKAETIDLEPVREAMQAAALKRNEIPAARTATPAAAVPGTAAMISSEAPSAATAEAGRVGVLLVNLGTPDAPKPKAVRRYLREFLSDRRVIEKDTFTWQVVLKCFILPFRPRRKARSYRTIWNRERNESPLKTITRAQAEKLGAVFAAAGSDTAVDWAMRYGNPSIDSRIKGLIAQNCERILLLPLYPQYSSPTTATVCDAAFRVLSRLRNQPTLRVAPSYYADPVYIEAVASSIEAELARLPFEPEVILASFHGMPLEYIQKGDPYYRQCARTVDLLRDRLNMARSHLILTFQSRFGRAEWLQPYTDETLRKLAKDGVKSVAVVTPGFASDCLETLEEIAIENAHLFKKRGGQNFAFIPCLNDSERGMRVIREVCARELNGWL